MTSQQKKICAFWIDLAINYQNKKLSHLSIQMLSETIKFFSSLNILSYVIYFTFHVQSLILKYIDDKNVLSHMHVSLTFFWSLILISQTMKYVQTEVSWKKLIFFLNILNWQSMNEFRLESDCFSLSDSATHQLSEDFIMQNQIWNLYHSADFFILFMNDEKCSLKSLSIIISCTECCLWLECWIISVSKISLMF